MSIEAIAWALRATGISPRAKLILLGLADYANHDTWICCPGRARLAQVGDCSLDTVDRAIKELEAAKLVQVVSRTREGTRVPTSNEYILDPSRMLAATPQNTPKDADAGGGWPQPCGYPSRTDAATVNQVNEPIIKSSPAHVDWKTRLKEAQDRAGEVCNLTVSGMHTYAALKALCEPTDGSEPCDWTDDVLPAIDGLAASLAARGKRLHSWTLVREHAIASRDARQQALPPVRQADTPTGRQPAARRRGYGAAIDDAWEAFKAEEARKGIIHG